MKKENTEFFVDKEGNACFAKGITEIPNNAFDENKELKCAIIPDSVECIGKRAFADCSNLKKLILNDNLKKICANAFTGCESLKKIDFPDSIQEIHGFAFFETYFSEPVISRSGEIFYRCPVVPGRKTYKVPDGVKVIQDGAFLYHKELEEVILPEGLEKIHMRAFCRTGIKRITIPASVKELSSASFMSCEKLKEVTILCDIENLPFAVFENCFEYGSNEYFKIIAPGQEMNFDEMLKIQGISIAEIPNKTILPDKDFWSDSEFVQLTEKCAVGDASAMMELGNYYKKQGNDEFCQLASNYWYYTAFLWGNEKAKLWYDKWFLENPGKRIPMPIIPYKAVGFNAFNHETDTNGALLRALGFGFFDAERTYSFYGFSEPGLIQICSWCNTEGPDEDGFGMTEEYDWWILDEFFNELPGVKMLHSYSFHERHYACTEAFDEQYENAKNALENKKALYQKGTITYDM